MRADAGAARAMEGALELVSEAVLITDAAGRIRSANPAAGALLGARHEDLPGEAIVGFVSPADRHNFRGHLARLRRSDRPLEWEVRLQPKLGPVRDAFVTAAAFASDTGRGAAGADGRVSGIQWVLRDVTYRRRVREALRESEQRFRAIFDNAFQFFGLLEPNGTVLEANQAALEMAGLRLRDVAGKGFAEAPWWDGSADSRARVRAAVGRAARGEFVREELEVAHRDGTTRVLDFSLKPVKDAAGRVALLIPEGRDITERRRIERALAESEERFRLLVERVKDHAIYFLDADGRVASWNPGASRLSGYAAQEVLGRHVSIFYLPADRRRGRPKQDLQAAVAGGQLQRHDWRRRKDGSRFWADFVIVPLKDATGHFRAFAHITRDITAEKQAEEALRRAHDELEVRVRERTAELYEANQQLSREVVQRKQAEQTLRESEALTRAILDTAVDAIVTIDPRGTIETFNRAAERLFGYKAGEVIGKNVRLLMPEPYSSQHDQYLENYLRTGHAKIIGIGREVVGLRKDGSTFPLDLAVSEVRLGGRHTFTGIIRDVTDRKRLEKEILEIAEREQRRIGQDLHDGVCQQLAGINFLVRALQQKIDSGLQPAPGEAGQLTALMSDAINQARGLSHGLNPVDPGADGLSAALRKLADNVRDMFHIRCTFRSNRPRGGPVLLHDPSAAIHLYRIAQEAVNNAMRHGRATRVVVSLNASANATTLAIDDDGVGFTKAPRSLQGPQAGPGMGLRTMRHRAHLIGATLDLGKSWLGGVKVTCRLRNKGTEEPDRVAPSIPAGRASKIRSGRQFATGE